LVIDLKPEQQRVIDLAVGSGAYETPAEVIDQAFAIIREQLALQDWMLERREALAAHIEKGFAQAAAGELLDEDVARQLLRQRRAERSKPKE
jgi:predicted transcriptional regulator